jgi:hypothetical protein
MATSFNIDIPAEIDINMVRGNDKKYKCIVRDVDDELYDITAATVIKLTVRDGLGGTEAFTVELGSGITIVGGVGEFELSVVSAKTAGLTSKTYRYDIEYQDPVSDKKTIALGNWGIREV